MMARNNMLLAWFEEAEAAQWNTPTELKQHYML